jgi:hypothetical protein
MPSVSGFTFPQTEAVAMTVKATKPKAKPAGRKAEPLDPAQQRRRYEELSLEHRVFGKSVTHKPRSPAH